MRRLGALGLAALLGLLLGAEGVFAADDITVTGGAYSDTLRAPDPQSQGKKYQAVTLGDAQTANQFLDIDATGAAEVTVRDGSGNLIGVTGAPFYVTGSGAVLGDSISVRCVNAGATAFETCAGSFSSADTVGSTVAFNDATDKAQVAIVGQQAVQLVVAAGTYDGTIKVRFSFDGGTTFQSDGNDILATLIDPETWADAPGLSLTNPNVLTVRSIVPPPGATHAEAFSEAFTSGAANVTLRATYAQPVAVLFASTTTGLQPVRMHTSAPASGDPALPVRVISTPTGAGGTSATDEATFTVGATAFTAIGGFHQTTRDTITNNQMAALALTARRAAWVQLETPVGDSPWDDAFDALQVVTKNQQQMAGQDSASTIASYTNCRSQTILRMTSATTTQLLAAGGANVRHHLCKIHVQFDTEAAGNTVKFVRGTGTNCGTGTTDITTVKTKSFIDGDGVNSILDGGADNEQLCATVVGTSPVSIDVRYTSL